MKVDKIEEYILEKIKNEEYIKGEMINSENQLSQKFNVSRMTVRKAIENLIQRNYLYRKHGKGTYVKDNSNKISVFLNEMIGFNERAKRYNLKAETKIINYKLIKADKILSEKLKIEEKEKVYCAEKLRLMNDEPVIYEIVFVPKKFIGNDENEFEKYLKYKNKYLKENNETEILKIEKEFEGILPDKNIKEKLELEEFFPVFKQEERTFLVDDIPFDITITYYNQDKYKFVEIINKNPIDKK